MEYQTIKTSSLTGFIEIVRRVVRRSLLIFLQPQLELRTHTPGMYPIDLTSNLTRIRRQIELQIPILIVVVLRPTQRRPSTKFAAVIDDRGSHFLDCGSQHTFVGTVTAFVERRADVSRAGDVHVVGDEQVVGETVELLL